MADSQRKTANLFDLNSWFTEVNAVQCTKELIYSGISITATASDAYVGDAVKSSGGTIPSYRRAQLIPVEGNTEYTLSLSSSPKCYLSFAAADYTILNDDYYRITQSNSPINYTFTTPNNCAYILLRLGKEMLPGDTYSFTNLMLVKGTIVPSSYEPYSPTGWLHSLRKLTTATEAVENPLYSDGTAITAYTIKGNEEHTGTPSPQNPVMPNGVGERTENLFDSSFTVGYYLNATTGLPQTTPEPRMATLTPIDVTDYDSVTFNFTRETSYLLQVMYSILDGNTLVSRVAGQSVPLTIDTSNATKLYLGVYPPDSSKQVSPDSISSVMLSEGSTAKPYEPYGYKIPIPSGGVTTNIYLGSTQSTRQIYKWEFTGNEAWNINDVQGSRFFYVAIPSAKAALSSSPRYCSHFTEEETFINPAGAALRIYDQNSAYADTTAFKAFLAQEYANGTPVTLWYVLAEPETAAVNEPLMKIGTYADTLSNAASIPTTEGANSITVDTTVQPSEFTATWTGWHNASVKELGVLLPTNPLCGIDTHKDTLNLETGACTRQIKKLVLTGRESWGNYGIPAGGPIISLTVSDYLKEAIVICACSHYPCNANISKADYMQYGVSFLTGSTSKLLMQDSAFAKTQPFKDFIAEQYDAGTPVTIWYMLATAETETVTVPAGLTGTEEGYLTQASTPTPTNPVYPTANGVETWV